MKTLCLLLIFSLSLSAQRILPMYADNPNWSVLKTVWGAGSTYRATYTKDTAFCSQTYSVYQHTSKKRIYVRSDSLRAWYRSDTSCQKPEKLIYDFSLEVGNQGYFPRDMNDSILLKVVKKGMINSTHNGSFEGIELDVVPSSSRKKVLWYKGIGSDMGPFYFLDQNFVYDAGTNLYCFSKNDTLKYRYYNSGSCDTTIITNGIGIINIKNSSAAFTPNPFKTKLQIQTSLIGEKNIKILDLLGKEVYFTRFSGISLEIDAQSWPSGLYWVQMEMGNEQIFQKILKE